MSISKVFNVDDLYLYRGIFELPLTPTAATTSTVQALNQLLYPYLSIIASATNSWAHWHDSGGLDYSDTLGTCSPILDSLVRAFHLITPGSPMMSFDPFVLTFWSSLAKRTWWGRVFLHQGELMQMRAHKHLHAKVHEDLAFLFDVLPYSGVFSYWWRPK